MTSESTKTERGSEGGRGGSPSASGSQPLRIAVAWTIVGVPLAYGVLKTVEKASALFT